MNVHVFRGPRSYVPKTQADGREDAQFDCDHADRLEDALPDNQRFLIVELVPLPLLVPVA
jgi:hypothetical protein